MRPCSGKFSAALTLPSVLAHPQCTDGEEGSPRRKKSTHSVSELGAEGPFAVFASC